MYQIIPLLPLLLATVEDLKKKAVSDIINYFMTIYTIFLAVYLYFKLNILPPNIIIALCVLLFFLVLFLLKALAIGDLFLMLWLSYYIGFLDSIRILQFVLFSFLTGYIIAIIYSLFICYRANRNKCEIVISFILGLIGYLLTIYLYKKLIMDITLLILSMINLLGSFVVFKHIEPFIKDKLIFKRSPKLLVEGDWIEEPIVVNDLPDNIEKKIEQLFEITKNKDKGYLLVPRESLFYGKKGLSKEQIEVLNELSKYTPVIVSVREGFPFVPALFIGYLLSIL